MAQYFGGRKRWSIAAIKHFGRQNIGGLAAVPRKIARIKVFYLQSFVLCSSLITRATCITSCHVILECFVWVDFCNLSCKFHGSCSLKQVIYTPLKMGFS